MGLVASSIPSLIPSVLAVGTYLTQPKPSQSSVRAAPSASVVAKPQATSAAELAALEAKDAQDAQEKAESREQAQREKNLLRRDRGLGGTVQTGVKGLLAQSASVAPKKTLLGQ
jgi:hypothetical protein